MSEFGFNRIKSLLKSSLKQLTKLNCLSVLVTTWMIKRVAVGLNKCLEIQINSVIV